MKTIEVILPDFVENLPVQEREILLKRLIALCSSERVKRIQKEMKKIREELKRYEEKYGDSFKEFEKRMPKTSSIELHEDYVDWFFWNQVYREKGKILKNYLEKRKIKAK